MSERELVYHGEVPTWVTIEDIETHLAEGQEYWFLKRFEFIPYPQSVKEHAYIMEPHSEVLTFHARNDNGGLFHNPLNKPAKEPAGNLPLQHDTWHVKMDGLPSDEIRGLRLPQNQHVTYNLWFERRRKSGAQPIEAVLRQIAPGKRILLLNPTAGLQQAILKAGYLPTSSEFGVTAAGKNYIAQLADAPKVGMAARVYYALLPFNGQIKFIELG